MGFYFHPTETGKVINSEGKPTISSASEMKICIRFGFSERECIWDNATQSGERTTTGKFYLKKEYIEPAAYREDAKTHEDENRKRK